MGMAAGLSALSSGLSIFGSLSGGNPNRGQAEGDVYQAFTERLQAHQGHTKAAQTNTAMSEHLTDVLANISAVRAAANTDPLSPTGAAITNRVHAQGDQDISRTVSNINQEADQHMFASYFYEDAAKRAIEAGNKSQMAGLLSGVSGLIGGLGGAFK